MTLLSPLVRNPDKTLSDILAADAALAGRARVAGAHEVVLSGPRGGPIPASHKERRRWELHVLMRIAAELGADEASNVILSWSNEESI